jgi:DNA-binding MarR family transcriptional regulator
MSASRLPAIWATARGSGQRLAENTAGAVLTDLILTTFRLNARFLEAAQDLATHGDLTAAWWQVLGGVLDQPRSVAAIGRRMGLTRQGVQRIADLLVERGLAEYRPNPDHRRAKLLACTEAGIVRRRIRSSPPWGNRIGGEVGADELRTALATMRQLIAISTSFTTRGSWRVIPRTSA